MVGAGVIGRDFTVIKFDGATGAEFWRRLINGTNSTNDVAVAVGVDAVGNVAAAGFTENTVTGQDFTVVKVAGTDGSDTLTPVNRRPVANNQSVTTDEDTSVLFNLTGSDPDGNSLTYHIVSGPTHGTITGGTDATRTDTPNPNFSGADSFTFKASDGTVDSAPATVSITVTPVNDAPVADAGPDQTVDSTSPAGAAVTLSGSGSDVDGDPLTFTWTGPFGTANGVTATVTVPVGTHTIALTVTDPGEATATDTVMVKVKSPSEMISDLVNLVESFNLQRGIENSLDAKLQNAQSALTAVRDGDSPTACNQLSAFINEAQAQSGQRLTVAQASQLIASASRIRPALGCA